MSKATEKTEEVKAEPTGTVETPEVVETKGSVEKSPGMVNRYFPKEITDLLSRPTPPEQIKTRQQAGQTLRYVDHAYVSAVLNEAFGIWWNLEIINEKETNTDIVITAELSVPVPGHPGEYIRKQQYGSAKIKFPKKDDNRSWIDPTKPISLGADYKAALSDALKKCASLLGVALDMYKKEDVSNHDGYGYGNSNSYGNSYGNSNRVSSSNGNNNSTQRPRVASPPTRSTPQLTLNSPEVSSAPNISDVKKEIIRVATASGKNASWIQSTLKALTKTVNPDVQDFSGLTIAEGKQVLEAVNKAISESVAAPAN